MKSNGRTKSPDATDLVKGLAAGLIGGLVASWTMNQFQALTTKLAEGMEESPGGKKRPTGEARGR